MCMCVWRVAEWQGEGERGVTQSVCCSGMAQQPASQTRPAAPVPDPVNELEIQACIGCPETPDGAPRLLTSELRLHRSERIHTLLCETTPWGV